MSDVRGTSAPRLAVAGGDLRNGYQRTDIDHLGAGEDEHWTMLPADLRHPDLSTSHSSPHASAWDQNSSTFSGLR